MEGSDGDVAGGSLDHDELQRAVSRLETLDSNYTRATEAVTEIVDLVRPELDRDFAAVEAYSGKTALSVEICELGLGTLAGVAADRPAVVGAHVDVLADALTGGPSAFVRQSAANTLRLLAEYDSAYVVSVLPAVVRNVDDSDWEVRRHCLSVLAECADTLLDGSDAVGTLAPRLRDENWLVRTEAARTVWNVAEVDATAVLAIRPALLVCLSDDEPDVRRVAGNALAATADAEFDSLRDAVRDRLVDGDTHKERAGALHCAHGLCTRYPDRTEPLTDAVLECVFDPNERVRSTAVDVLETFARLLPGRRDAIVDHLLDALEDPDWTVTSAAAEGLAVIAEGFPEYAEKFVDPLVETLTDDSKLGPYYSGRSIATFLDSVPEMTSAVEAGLRERLLVGDLRVRKNVAMALYELDPDEFENATRVLESVVDTLDTGSGTQQRRAAASLATVAFTDPAMLTAFDPERIADPLREPNELPAKTYVRRMVAVTVLFDIEADVFAAMPWAVEAAVAVLAGVDESADTDVRLFTARALGKETTVTRCSTPTDVIESLVKFTADADEAVRRRALAGLVTAAERYPGQVERHLGELESATGDPHPDCRSAAATAIGTVGSRRPEVADRCLDRLAALSADDRWQTQAEAYRGFEAIAEDRPDAVSGYLDVLVVGLGDHDEDVQVSATEALAAVLGSDAIVAPHPELAPRLRDVASDPNAAAFSKTVAVELLVRM